MPAPLPPFLFEAIFAQSPNSTVLYDAAGKPLAINPAFERLWGARLEDVPAGYSVRSDPQLEAAGILPAIERAFAGEAIRTPPTRYEMERVTGVGRTLWTEAQLFPVRDASGAVTHVVLVHHDVTQRVEEQERLRSTNIDLSTTNEFLVQQHAELEDAMADLEEAREEADRLRLQVTSILDSLTDSVAGYDREWRVRYLNPAARRLLEAMGLDPDAAQGRVIWELVPAMAGTAWERECRRAVDEGRVVEFVEHHAALDRWFENRVVPSPGGLVTTYSRDITDRYRAESEARRAADRHRALVETSTAMVWTASADGMVDDLPFWRELTGQSEEEVRGTGWVTAVHPEDREAVARTWWESVRNKVPYECEYRLRLRDGSFRWFDARAVPLREPDGSLREWVGVFSDINEDKRETIRREFLVEAGRVLGESLDAELTLQRVAQLAVPDLADWCAVDMLEDPGDHSWPPRVRRLAVAHKDPARVQWARDLERRLPQDWEAPTGLPRVLREGVTEFYPVIDSALIEAAAVDEAQREVLREIDFHALLIVPMAARGEVLGALTFAMTESGRRYTEDDRILGETFAARAAAAVDNARLLARAVEARAEAERAASRTARLQAVTAALSRALTPAEAVDAMVSEGLPALGADEASVFLLGADGAALDLVRTHGMPPESARNAQRMPLDAPMPVADAVRNARTLVLEEREDVASRYPEALRGYELAGAKSWIVLPFVVEEHALGAVAFGFHQERHFSPEDLSLGEALAGQCAQALERARLYAEAEAASSAKSQFLATMSHELRTPLNAIAGHVQLMEMGLHGPLTEPQREALGRVARAQRHLLGLINDVLNFSRLEAGRVDYDFRDVLVRDVIADIVPMVEPQLAAKGIHFQSRLPEMVGLAPIPVWADPEKLGQILLNLLSNAAKFTPHGGCVGITMRLDPDGDGVLVEVSDSGIGIPPEKVERIFDPFVQVVTDAANRREGTGLGLAISRELARGMGGDITVRSEPGRGSCFTVALPAHRT